jgi:hypothetical protein
LRSNQNNACLMVWEEAAGFVRWWGGLFGHMTHPAPADRLIF